MRGTFRRGASSASSSNPARLTGTERRSQQLRSRLSAPSSSARTSGS